MQNLQIGILDRAVRGEDTYNLPIGENSKWRGIRIILKIFAVLGGTPTLNVKLQSYDPVNDAYADISGASLTEKTAAGSDDLVVYPGIGAVNNRRVSDVLPRLWRAVAVVNGDATALAESVLTSNASPVTDGKVVVIGNRTYILKSALTEVKASSTLTGDGTIATTGSIITIGDVVYTYRTTLTEVKATGTLTNGNTVNMSDGDTVAIGKWNAAGNGPTIYTFKTTLVAGIKFQIKIGVDADTTLANLVAAINGDSGAGTKYTTGTPVHPTVSAGAVVSHVSTLTAKTIGIQGDLNILLSSAPTRLTTSGANMTGGIDAVPYEVLRVTDDDTCLANLVKAINLGGTAGTEYSTGTAAHPYVTATSITNVLTAVAKVPGVAANALSTLAGTSPDSHQDWADVTLGGGAGASTPGVDPVVDEVYRGANAAATLDNIKKAINGTGVEGTDYSTGTTAHTQVDATDNADTTQKVVAKSGILAATANALDTTTDETTLSWADTTLGGGTGASNPGVDPCTFDFSLTGSYQV